MPVEPRIGIVTELRASGICEQDIDILLWEELVASPDFRSWFLGKIGIDAQADLISASRSLSGVNGESDLELELRGEEGTIRVLIENKIGAPLQPRQAERYAERGALYLEQGSCGVARTVIVAPNAYLGPSDDCLGFDARVPYESVIEWFEMASGLGARRECKLALLREAVDHGGWRMVPDETATEFWRLYWEHAFAIAPELRMEEPRQRPATSFFILFRPTQLPRRLLLQHKLPYGNVDLQFAGMGDRLSELEAQYGRYLEADMRIERAGKSAVIRISVPRIALSAPFSTSRAAVDQGIRAAVRLLALYRRSLSENQSGSSYLSPATAPV